MKLILPIRKRRIVFEIDSKGCMPKKKKHKKKTINHPSRTKDPEANHTPSRNSHSRILCLPLPSLLLLSLCLAYPRPFTIGTSIYARFIPGGGPHMKGFSSPSSSSYFIRSCGKLCGAVRPPGCRCTIGLLGRKSGSESEGSGSTGVDPNSAVLALSFPLSGLAVLEGVTRSQILYQPLNLTLREQRKDHTKVDNLFFLPWSLQRLARLSKVPNRKRLTKLLLVVFNLFLLYCRFYWCLGFLWCGGNSPLRGHRPRYRHSAPLRAPCRCCDRFRLGG